MDGPVNIDANLPNVESRMMMSWDWRQGSYKRAFCDLVVKIRYTLMYVLALRNSMVTCEFRGDVKIHWLQHPYSAASCSQLNK